MIEKITTLLKKYQKEFQITKDGTLNKKIHKLQKIDHLIQEITAYQHEITENLNQEMHSIYLDEITNLKEKIHTQFEAFKNEYLTNLNVMLEIRSGEGGQEAELFALELLEMYQKVCKKMNWQCKVFAIYHKESGGIKECICEISGPGVEKWLMMESGVHCVKRVPKTEKKGRIHTSTATVAILKQPHEIEVTINEKDLKIEVFRSSGPGGQSVNTTDSAVRITHLPTGIVVSQQDGKSQIKNKEKALKILKARIYDQQLQEEMKKNEDERRSAIGHAKRNERIRTYHFTQNWVNDTRVSFKSHSITKFMEGDDLILFLNDLLFLAL